MQSFSHRTSRYRRRERVRRHVYGLPRRRAVKRQHRCLGSVNRPGYKQKSLLLSGKTGGDLETVNVRPRAGIPVKMSCGTENWPWPRCGRTIALSSPRVGEHHFSAVLQFEWLSQGTQRTDGDHRPRFRIQPEGGENWRGAEPSDTGRIRVLRARWRFRPAGHRDHLPQKRHPLDAVRAAAADAGLAWPAQSGGGRSTRRTTRPGGPSGTAADPRPPA